MMKKKKHRYFTNREVLLFGICLLEGAIIVYDIFFRQGVSIKDIIVQDIFTFVTSVICSIVATAALPKGVQNNDSEELAEKIEQKIRTLFENSQYVLPVASYVDTNDPNREFNKKLNESISNTQNYLYFGDRALYLTKRLGKDIHQTNNRLAITVLLADIRDDDLFSARADAYMQKERSLQQADNSKHIRNIDEIINEEKLEVIRSLYALGKLNEKYSIRVYLHKEIPFIRFEITDRLLVLSFLTQLTTGKKYPTTVLYENENIFKPNFEDYAKEVIKRSYPMKEKDLSLSGLLSLSRQANMIIEDIHSITDYYNTYVKD